MPWTAVFLLLVQYPENNRMDFTCLYSQVNTFQYLFAIDVGMYELDKVIHEVCDMDKPFLGICLGLQLLFE